MKKIDKSIEIKRDAAIARALATPHKPHKPIKKLVKKSVKKSVQKPNG
jgi:hypothetical protein